jgi:alpha-ketoglutarate-dependent taurine dioxygenase
MEATVMVQHDEFLLQGTSVPVVWQAAVGVSADASIDELCEWLKEQRRAIEDRIYRHGGILLRGFSSLKDASDFQRVLDILCPDLLDYVGGSAPRKAVRGRIMTTSELPGNCSVPLHQEMAYTNNGPDRVAFFCQIPAPMGGETTVGDMRKVTKRIDPALIRRFEDHKGMRIRRNLAPPDKVASRPGIPRAWTVAFGTDDRGKVDEIVKRSGWENKWLDDGSMELWQEIRPALCTHPRTGERIWYNQLHRFTPIGLLKRAEQDGHEEMVRGLKAAMAEAPHLLDQTFYGDGTPVADEDVVQVFDILTEETVPVHWQRGDVIILDNILVSHGRTRYSGDRKILTALIRTPEATH